MKIYRKNNKICIENGLSNQGFGGFNSAHSFSDEELKELLNDKRIFDFICYRLAFIKSIDFYINNNLITVYYDDFIDEVKKSNLPLFEKSKIFRIGFLEKENKTKYLNKLLNSRYGKLTGNEILEIYLSDRPIEMCKEKGITFSEFISIISSHPFYLTSRNQSELISHIFMIPKIKADNDELYRRQFYMRFVRNGQEKLPYPLMVDLYTDDREELKRRLESLGFTLEEYANRLETFPELEANWSWARRRFKDYDEMAKGLEDIWRNVATGRTIPKTSHKFKYMENKISDEVKKQFLDELESLMEYNLTDIQKAYYLYRRICQKFSYDDEFYVTHEGRTRRPHGNLSRASEFDFEHNLVVCYDIAFIYAKLCQEIGLHAEMREGGFSQDWNYVGDLKDDHPHVIVWAGNMAIKADPSSTKINNDMAKEKSGERVKEFICANSGPKVIRQFEKELELVDQILATRKKDYEFYDIEEMLKKHTETEEITEEEIEATFIDIIKEINDIPGTMMGKTKAVRGIAHKFTNKYQQEFEVTFVSDSNPLQKDHDYSLAFVISIENGNEYNYYLVKHLGNVEKISREDLMSMVGNKEIKEIDYGREIPGINIR